MKYHNIVVAVDNDVYSDHVYKRALELAESEETQMTLVHVVQPAPPLIAPGVMGSAPPTPSLSEEQQEEIMETAESEIAAIAARLGKERSCKDDRPVHHRVVQSPEIRMAVHDVAHEINADLIVAGSHGRHGFALFFSGSTASDILKDSPCDVLAVRLQE